MRLKRYWFTFEKLEFPTPLNLGCGVTAFDVNDARTLIYEMAIESCHVPTELSYVENVDISTLDKKHVLPNMGSPILRGIWFPLARL
jgi:hypothetical protein